MPRPYSGDLRARVIEEIASGASRREAAERYGISASVVVIWAQRWKQTGSFMAKPSGGSISPLEDHAEFLLVLIAKQPDLTLDEIVARRKACLIRPDWCLSTKPAPTPAWCGFAAVVRAESG
jgi:transposase